MYKYTRIRDLREDKDLRQEDIAKLLYLNREVYRRYETGEREIPLHLMIELADVYQVSMDYLTDRTNKKEVNK